MYSIVEHFRLVLGNVSSIVCQYRTELCQFSGYKILPGHGKRYVRLDGKVRIIGGSTEVGIWWCAGRGVGRPYDMI